MKVGVVLDLIEERVLTKLSLFTIYSKGCCSCYKQGFKIAVANAENNHDLNVKTYCCRTFVGAGPTLKRFSQWHGKAFRITKRTSHITVVV